MKLPLFLLAIPVLATANPDAGFPKSYEVLDDGRVMFRFDSESAESITVRGDFGSPVELEKTSDKRWEGTTTEPVEPGVHDYSFRVDGTYALDPHNRWIKGWRRSGNLFEVPSEEPAPWQVRNVPHGQVAQITYHSDTLDTERTAFVYTPPGYADATEALPVLFLLHGSGDDASAWSNVGRAHIFADNLIADGRMKPMVIVMPHGHAAMPGVDKDKLEDKGEWFSANNDAVRADYMDELLPHIAANWNIRTDREGRAITGLSMGGGQSLILGLNHPDQFGWVGAFSSGIPGGEELIRQQLGNLDDADYELFWVACGKDDFLFEQHQLFHRILEEGGVEHEFVTTEGAHSWPVWRQYLEDFLPQLFQN